MSVFEKNINALKAHQVLYGKMIRAMKDFSDDEYRLITAKSGVPTLVLKSADGKSTTFHSRYNPLKEAQKLIEQTYSDETYVFVLGMGLGYVLDCLAEKAKSTVGLKIFVVEPDIKMLLAALKSRDVSHYLKSGSIVWCVGMTADEVGNLWETSLDWTSMNKLAIIEHPASAKMHIKYYERIVEKIRYLCNKSKGNLVTMMNAGFEFHTNYFKNLGSCFGLPGVDRLFNKFKSVPAIIVAAGPSLDKNMHLLKKVKGKFPIIAVDTALRQLVANGIKPDIACAADPSYENSLDFVGMENEKEVLLAIEPMTHPDILECYQGPKMLMSFSGGLFPTIKKHRESIGVVICWGSIATTVFDLARKMGADPLVFIGLDLSFQDGRLHARGSYSDDRLYESVNPYSSIENESALYVYENGTFRFSRVDGSVLLTDHNMKIYRDWFEDQFRQTQQTVINATEGGIVDKHVVKMTLQSVIDKYYDKGVSVSDIIKQALKKPVEANYQSLISELNSVKKSMHRNENESRKAVGIIKKLLTAYSDYKPDNLQGSLKADFYDIMKLHDEICSHTTLFPWLSVHQTRFVTKHTMELNKLKVNTDATVKHWLERLVDFFNAINKFNTYQLPLIEEAVISLNEVSKSKTKVRGNSDE